MINDAIGNTARSDPSKNKEPANASTSTSSSANPSARTSIGRRAVLGGVGAVAFMGISGCETMFLSEEAQATSTPIRWNEEVRFADGRVIVVRQGRGTSRLYNGNRVVLRATLASLRFVIPEIQSTPIEWSDRFMPLILNVYEGELYVGGSPFLGRHFEEFGRPRSGWVVQRYDPSTQAWVRIPASKTPEPIRKTNLLIDLPPPESFKLVTLEIKASVAYNGNSGIDLEIKQLDPNRRTTYGSGYRDQALTD